MDDVQKTTSFVTRWARAIRESGGIRSHLIGSHVVMFTKDVRRKDDALRACIRALNGEHVGDRLEQFYREQAIAAATQALAGEPLTQEQLANV
jgi:hypothetical protein